ncbi:AAA family ATPase [Litoreibacter halocynthiae]|uniref:AAA family ATPase n=1 Tax=Litoreibacter halocynthiae TaxID=1242689 RepID=UPI002491F973|nr:hypothetical protein [Litoreibacter halocynthiae]
MPFDSSASQSTIQFVAYVCTDQGAAVARSVVERSGGKSDRLHGGGLSGAARLCSDVPPAQFVLTEIGNIPVEMACECVSEIRRSGANVIVLGEQTDINTYRALRKAGALEYFTFPVNADEILAVQGEETVPIELPRPPAQCPSIAVIGSNGGVGSSLLAQNLAFHAASSQGANLRTALLDADLFFGSQAIDLDRDETPGLFEALKAPDRIDQTFIGATMDHISDHLSLYSHQIRVGQDAQSYEAGLSRLFAPLRTEFDTLVTDLPRNTLMQHPDIAEQIEALILVIPAGFSGVNAASRLIERIKVQSPKIRILPVLSELRRDAALSRKDVAKTIGLDVIATLPRCDTVVMRAHRAARPLIESQPRSPYAKEIRAIWKAAVARTPATGDRVRRPLMKRIFG